MNIIMSIHYFVPMHTPMHRILHMLMYSYNQYCVLVSATSKVELSFNSGV